MGLKFKPRFLETPMVHRGHAGVGGLNAEKSKPANSVGNYRRVLFIVSCLYTCSISIPLGKGLLVI